VNEARKRTRLNRKVLSGKLAHPEPVKKAAKRWSRPSQKNDNAWVEQKNWTHVRKLVGYLRYGTHQQQEVQRDLYRCWADYQNFFQP
jgi:hypothetical protein